MLFKSRVISSIDTSRLAEAVSYPGIDPRIWVSYAVLTSDPYFEEEDGQQDVIADVLLLPSNMPETARVGAIYAGNGFGLYAPLHKDDEVLVVAPSGNPDQGIVITQRLWSPADLPPAEAAAAPYDVTLMIEPGRNLRMGVKGAGSLYLTSESGKIVLGEEAATRGVARINDTTLNGTLSLSAIAIPPSPPVQPVPAVAITLTYTPPGGIPQTSTVTLGVATLISALGSLNLTGKIDAASEKVVSA